MAYPAAPCQGGIAMSSGRIVTPCLAVTANCSSNLPQVQRPRAGSTLGQAISRRSILTPAAATRLRLDGLFHTELRPTTSPPRAGSAGTARSRPAPPVGGSPPEDPQ